MSAYRDARKRAFLRELEDDRYGSQITYKGRTFIVNASSKSAHKDGRQANYLGMKNATFDLPIEDSVLPLSGRTAPGFMTSGITLKETVTEDGIDFQIFEIQDATKEPFIRLVCNRLQGMNTKV